MKDSAKDPRIQAWFDERPELLTRYPNHWVVVNIKRRGVMVADTNQTMVLDKLAKYEANMYDKNQPVDEVFIVHTATFKGHVE